MENRKRKQSGSSDEMENRKRSSSSLEMEKSSSGPSLEMETTSRARKKPCVDSIWSQRDRGAGMRDGWWYSPTRVKKAVRCIVLENKEKATKLRRLLDKVHHPNMPTLLAFKKAENNLYKVVIERLLVDSYSRFFSKGAGGRSLWRLNRDGSKFLEMDRGFQIILRSIVKALSQLHNAGRCHGKLLEGIWVSECGDPEVKLANFDIDIAFKDGFYKDLSDFKRLVKQAVKKYSNGILVVGKLPKKPYALKSFYRLYKRFKSLDFDAARYLFTCYSSF